MSAWLLAALLAGTAGGPRGGASMAPTELTVATSRGEAAVPVSTERGGPAVAAVQLAALLPLDLQTDEDWAVVTLGGRAFRFLLGAPLFLDQGQAVPLVSGAYVTRDTLFLPLQWLTGYVPRVFHEAYHYDPLANRFEEVRLAPVIRAGPVAHATIPAPAHPPARSGTPAFHPPPGSPLHLPHTVVIDPGHGGSDPGNPGLAFPAGVHEKDVTLAIGKVLKTELERRGITAKLTRSTDVLVDLGERALMCDDDCDLFVSIHVNSLPRRRGYQKVDGIETYFLSEARTAEAKRVAAMENDALRYETSYDASKDTQFAFILKDLQRNEYLRESASLAEDVQESAAGVSPGEDRGVSQAAFVVLTTAHRPAILVETGYSTNPSDARFLVSPEGQRRLASAIADGIVKYLAQYERKTAASAPQ
jgi:N-acetylmuramoyl-L-alanine amidase